MLFHLAIAWRPSLDTKSSTRSFPKPMPAQEWIVEPPMFTPAMPVGAVIATSSNFCRSESIMALRRTDFPVPDEMMRPVSFMKVRVMGAYRLDQ